MGLSNKYKKIAGCSYSLWSQNNCNCLIINGWWLTNINS